ncbi:uncharacterized protein F4822DRAFT_419852 [Hypoxylon trugodes]|uniref:uncharacterized protein n=1 Tax=Hypoxylon trugodes TaxID=326681 RepID=UPI00219B65A6|nr:uncharacterized protein F4822DRAFT_419852 [Hypoxylon trugodes]KAI1383240.1 hypothetical protein F4822DRAFT_419852 [Hypoxylon trugodes]
MIPCVGIKFRGFRHHKELSHSQISNHITMTFGLNHIKRLFNRKEKKKEMTTSSISWPIGRPPQRQDQNQVNRDVYDDIRNVPIHFTPRTQGEEATRAFVKNGMSDDLIKLLDDRDDAERQLNNAPKTKGTEEVQRILREPSRKSIEDFHNARNRAEATKRYGIVGDLAYHVDKYIRRNSVPVLPPLQLIDFGMVMRREYGGFFSSYSSYRATPISSTPVDWLALGFSMSSAGKSPSLSLIGERSNSRDSLDANYDSSSRSSLESEINMAEHEWLEELASRDVREASTLTIHKVPASEVRITQINPPKD